MVSSRRRFSVRVEDGRHIVDRKREIMDSVRLSEFLGDVYQRGGRSSSRFGAEAEERGRSERRIRASVKRDRKFVEELETPATTEK